MITKAPRIIIVSAVAATISQIGNFYVSIESGIVRPPTAKSTLMIFLVAIGTEILTYLYYHVIITRYDKKVFFITLIADLFFLLAVVTSLMKPVCSASGETLFRYPTLAAVLFTEFAFEIRKPVACQKIAAKFGIEHFFAIIALALGTVLCVSLPVSSLVCFDDGQHYGEAVYMSEGIYPSVSEADLKEIYMETEYCQSKTPYWDNIKAINQEDKNFIVLAEAGAFSPKNIGVFGGVLGMWLGRLLNLEYSGVFISGKIGILLVYVLLMYKSIERLKYGKNFLALCGLIPAGIFLASSYSADSWMIGFFALGFSYFFSALQSPNEKLTVREMVIMILAFLLGSLPKAPYAFLVLFLIFIPKEKYESVENRKRFITACIITFLALYLWTALESFSGGDVQDSHLGGVSNVSGIGQIAFMLSNPSVGIKAIAGCVKQLFNPFESYHYLTNYAFLGVDTSLYVVVLFGLILTALTDNPTKKEYPYYLGTRAVGLSWIVVQMAVIATVFYLAFTPVGSTSVLGCQPRYMLPMVFPVLMFLFNGYLPGVKKYKWVYTAAVFLFGIFINIHCYLNLATT